MTYKQVGPVSGFLVEGDKLALLTFGPDSTQPTDDKVVYPITGVSVGIERYSWPYLLLRYRRFTPRKKI